MLLIPSWILQLIIFIVFLICFLWMYSVRNFDYWKKRGVYSPKPTPFLGNIGELVFLKKCLSEWLSSLYFSTDERFFGVFMFDEPSLVLKDPKLIQLVMMKDADYFPDRSNAEPQDEIMSNFMFFQKSPRWKSDRTKLTPVFTSGKLKAMFSLIYNVAEEMVKYLEDNVGKIEAKDISARYSTDVIAKCAFGIDAYCFDDQESDFRKYGRLMLEFSLRNAFSQMSYFFIQTWVKIFHINLFSEEVRNYFSQAFTQTMKSRELSKTRVNDFVDLLIDLKNSNQLPEELATKKACGQALMFFAAGFETTSSSISFTLHELCLNREVQNKVRAEILETIKNHGGITYESIQDMKYLKNCIYGEFL
nr:cytochrome P450 6k1-like [Leptinotarsa decemlineata]